MASNIFDTETTFDASAKIWRGRKQPITYDEKQTLGKVVLASLKKQPNHIAQICHHNGKQYTNQDIITYSIRVAQYLDKIGLKEDDIIGVCAANSDFLAPVFFGAMLQGCIISTLDPSFEKDGIKHTYSTTKPKLLFCDGAIYSRVKEALKEIPLDIDIYTMKDHIEGVPKVTDMLKETKEEKNFKAKELRKGSNQIAAILCSSGTTGLPKGVCLSHSCLLNAELFKLEESDSLLCFSTLYWLSGVICLVGATIKDATRVINDRGYSPQAFFEIIEKYKLTSVFTPPSQMALAVASKDIAKYDLSSLKYYLTGGSAIPIAIVEQIRPYIGNAEIIVGYGMSEVAGAISIGPVSEEGANGHLVSNFEAKIINPEGEQLGPTEVGEICIRSPFKWHGYYNNPEATKQILDDEGWIHSGDLGYFSSNGQLYVIDRIKEILKYNNFHFYPTEIERVISKIPGVHEVCVCGLPDIVSTHLPAALVVKSTDVKLTAEDIYDYVAANMDHFKQLRGGVYFVDEIPKTASGKNLRREVVKICQQMKQREATKAA